jgi:alkylresorcinol/alkylpyrone synthase
MQSCSLLSLATAVPRHFIAQAKPRRSPAAHSAAGRRCSTALSGVFDNAAIARRHIVAPVDWYEQPHGWSDRNALYLEGRRAVVRGSRGRGD